MIELIRNLNISIKQYRSAFPLLSPILIGLMVLLLCNQVQAQDTLPLQDLSAFKNPGENWKIAGQVTASLDETNTITMSKGTGILVNDPKNHQGKDLYTTLEHGDIDLELDYMMPKGANSGIYLQGRYELQLLDSWTVKDPTSGDNGGIYERWDPSRPDGKKGYQGYAPRQNVSRAPGLWQHLEISFRAPRFDGNGNKIKNANILKVELNGVTIHEDVELMGPTRGAIGEGEVARGPLRIQGDHGAVAFRNIEITRYDTPALTVEKLSYKVFAGGFEELPDFDTLSMLYQANSDVLTAHLAGVPSQFLVRYSGTLAVKEEGAYHFDLNTAGGSGFLQVNGDEVIPFQGTNRGTATLPKGKVPFELVYAKRAEQADPGLGLAISAKGLRKQWVGDTRVGQRNVVNPIYVTAREKPLLRSFRDLPDGTRLSHTISVGSLSKVHYTYDLNHGNLVQVWRGNFLNTTPMWHRRGDGSSRPLGSVETLLLHPSLAINKLENEQAAWPADTAGTGFRPKGYILDENENPVFQYKVYGASVRDKIRVFNKGRGVQRTITLKHLDERLYCRLASGTSIRKVEGNRYLVGEDHSYYIQIDDPGGSRAILRTIDGHQELILPAREEIHYTILF